MTTSEKQAIVRDSARLMLLCSAALTLYLYVSSPISAAFPTNSRYLIGLLISTPALIWPLWGLAGDNGVTSQRTHSENNDLSKQHNASHLPYQQTTLKIAMRRGILALIGILLLVGTINAFLEIPTVQAYNQQQDALIHELTRLKITHFYTDYWTCDSIIFLSKEHIICSSIDNALRPHYNRYLTLRLHSSNPTPIQLTYSRSAQVKSIHLLKK